MNNSIAAVNVYLIDDESDVTRSLSFLLESIHIPSRSFTSAVDFLDTFDYGAGPCCIVLDLRMPGIGGLELMQKLKNLGYDVPVILLSAHGDIPAAVRAMQLGAVDFLQKPFNPQQFLDSVNRAIELATEKFAQRTERADNEKRLQKLSPREREVFDLLLQGSASKEIAKTLQISYKTVDVHRASLLRKLDVASYRELIKKIEELRPRDNP